MPSYWSDDLGRADRTKERARKLIAKGIDPRSLKFMRLLYRRGK